MISVTKGSSFNEYVYLHKNKDKTVQIQYEEKINRSKHTLSHKMILIQFKITKQSHASTHAHTHMHTHHLSYDDISQL